jgi:1,4-dihydroxy-2-naphthoate polyprenyltransferase
MREGLHISSWLSAFRLRTLPLALASIGMGSFLAYHTGAFQWNILLFACLTTSFLQILSNLANDYGDSIHGADHSGRQGPARMVQTGAITASAMRNAMGVMILLSLVSGVTLLYLSLGFEWKTFLFFFGLGILAIAAAIFYTSGKKPYGYLGLGDVSVVLFFGLIGVMGVYYLYVGGLNLPIILPSISCGLFAAGVLNVNNIRDIESDREAGKRSIPVRIGRERAVMYHMLLIVIGWMSALLYTFLFYQSIWQLLYLICLPLFILNIKAVSKKTKPAELDPYLRQMALSTLIFVILFGISHSL